MEYWKQVNEALEKIYGCTIMIRFNEIDGAIVVYKLLRKEDGKTYFGQPTSWFQDDVDRLFK